LPPKVKPRIITLKPLSSTHVEQILLVTAPSINMTLESSNHHPVVLGAISQLARFEAIDDIKDSSPIHASSVFDQYQGSRFNINGPGTLATYAKFKDKGMFQLKMFQPKAVPRFKLPPSHIKSIMDVPPPK
jgi:hypothetical protein